MTLTLLAIPNSRPAPTVQPALLELPPGKPGRVALMSPGHFSRSFRTAFGETPYSYLMTRRIERAKALLRRGDLTVTEVCMAVGCTSLGSFSSRFTELVGESPSAYRARRHDDGAVIPACIAKIHTRPVRNGEALTGTPPVA